MIENMHEAGSVLLERLTLLQNYVIQVTAPCHVLLLLDAQNASQNVVDISAESVKLIEGSSSSTSSSSSKHSTSQRSTRSGARESDTESSDRYSDDSD